MLSSSMALTPIKPLDGPGEYPRWKESVLLRVRSLRLHHVLVEDCPSEDDEDAAAERWERDDALCRGHILGALSDRLFPDYTRFATARGLWRALARTYDVEMTSLWEERFSKFRFDTSAPFLEQLAHAEAMGVAAELSDRAIASGLHAKLPETIRMAVASPDSSKKGMRLVWDAAPSVVSISNGRLDFLWLTEAEISQKHSKNPGLNQGETSPCSKCGELGHVARKCKDRA